MYLPEKVRPSLHDLDSEQLLQLFADLGRESIATGSYPIVLQHLESMIRMAEVSAPISLRQYVCADDINLTIPVATASISVRIGSSSSTACFTSIGSRHVTDFTNLVRPRLSRAR